MSRFTSCMPARSSPSGKEVLRDYRYIEATGLGVPRKIVAGMQAHNGTEPDLVEEESRFIVRLWKHPHAADAGDPTEGET